MKLVRFLEIDDELSIPPERDPGNALWAMVTGALALSDDTDRIVNTCWSANCEMPTRKRSDVAVSTSSENPAASCRCRNNRGHDGAVEREVILEDALGGVLGARARAQVRRESGSLFAFWRSRLLGAGERRQGPTAPTRRHRAFDARSKRSARSGAWIRF